MLVQQHHGQIAITSTPGQGTQVITQFPRVSYVEQRSHHELSMK